jgi:SecD/SecF fusion protein
MKSPFFWRIVICVVPTLIALAVTGAAVRNYAEGNPGLTFKLGVDLVGGTILVYEVDQDKLKEQRQNQQGQQDEFKIEKLVEVLSSRINPADQKGITIRPVGKYRVEIILPTGGKHQAQIEDKVWQDLLAEVKAKWPPAEDKPYVVPRGQKEELIRQVRAQEAHKDVPATEIDQFIESKYKKGEKNLTTEEVQDLKDKISQVGSLEFRILANTTDDPEAIDAARKEIERARTDAALKDLFEERERRGLPPPPPGIDPATKTVKPFDTVNMGKHTYSWVELDKPYRHDLHLHNAAENDPAARRATSRPELTLWRYMAQARAKDKDRGGFGEAVEDGGMLLYSREVANPSRLPDKDKDKRIEYFVLARDPEPGKEIKGDDLAFVGSGPDEKNMPAVRFRFNSKGSQQFYDLTTKNKPTGGFFRHLAILYDGRVMSAPVIKQPIRGEGIISGGGKGFTQTEVDRLVEILRSGALPATLLPQPVSENTIGPTLGEDTIKAGTTSVALAFLAVVVFMIIYYRFAGLVACAALLCNLLFTVAFMVIVSATFTLPGLAGLVLMLGMAVDANILIYERLREERERGASLPVAIRNGYDRAFPTIIDTHLSSIFTAIVLYIVGNDQLKGFGISLTVGLIISLFTSLYMTRLLFDLWQAKGWLKKLSMLKLFSRPNIDFMGIRYYCFGATVTLTILGLALFIFRLPSPAESSDDLGDVRSVEGSILNIDFIGGTKYSGQLAQRTDIQTLRERLSERRQKEVLNVKQAEPLNPRGKSFSISLVEGEPPRQVTLPQGEMTAAELADAKDRLKELLPDVSEERLREIKEKDVKLLDENPRATRFRLIYPDGDEHTIQLANPAAKSDVELHARRLPDLTVEQVWSSNPEYTQGSQSVFFTVRTSERASELVQAAIARLLRDDQGHSLLRQVKITGWQLLGEKDGPAREAELTFSDFASPTQVRRLLSRELEGQGINVPSSQIKAFGEGVEENGRFQKMRVSLPADIEAGKFGRALTRTAEQFGKSPQPESLENFDKQLAAETQQRALIAILASWGAILLYLWFRFGNWTFGLAAVLCLIHDLFLTLGIIAACHYIHDTALGRLLLLGDFKIDLPTVAALLTLVGYSVNDTIVVFDRIREVRGKNPELTPQMINDSINQALSRTLLTSLIVWIVVVMLYLFGGEGVHLFGFVMVIGVIVGTYSSIYVASPLLLMFGEGKRLARVREREPQPAGARE